MASNLSRLTAAAKQRCQEIYIKNEILFHELTKENICTRFHVCLRTFSARIFCTQNTQTDYETIEDVAWICVENWKLTVYNREPFFFYKQ